MLASEIIDRCFSEWLYPAGINRPAYDTVATQGVLNGTTNGTFTVSGRVPNIPNDTILEIDSELILTQSVSGTTVTTQERGYLESDATTHTVGTKVVIDPKYPRKVILNAIKTTISQLYPNGVYNRKTDTTTTWSFNTPTKALPAGGKRLISILADTPATQEEWRRLRPGRDYVTLQEFAPPKYRLKQGGYEGGALNVVYAADFDTSAVIESSDLDSIGVPSTLQPYLPLGVAGYLLQGREVPRVQIEDIRRQLASNGITVGSALNVGQTLLQTFFRIYVNNEAQKLKEQDPTTLEYVR